MSDLTELDLNKLTKDLKEQLKKAKESGIIENKKKNHGLQKRKNK